MEHLTATFNFASQFNQFGRGLLILYAVSKALKIEADFESIPSGVKAEAWNTTTTALSNLTQVEQLAFASSLIDEIGREVMRSTKK
ncbi:hypothetical protein [Nostoc sp.]|uniref:hypothetical protein n=1 Tax=Nostoc sp. TaxID=1180 RepID=UPI002FFBAC70